MSTRSARTRRTGVVLATLATVTGVAWATPSTAGAHPGVFDSETCAASLTRVWHFPCSLSDEPDAPQVFSDGYESYVLRQPPCDGTRPVPASYVPDPVGHGDPL
jgi:hypothetical protein